MTNFLRGAAQAIHIALCKLHDIQFNAPWSPRAGNC